MLSTLCTHEHIDWLTLSHNKGSRDESQRIAAWKQLYRVRHPGPNVSRLQTIS